MSAVRRAMTRLMGTHAVFLAAVALIATGVMARDASHGEAKAAKKVEFNQDPVFVFNRICYAQVPNLQAIRTMAQKLAWKPITGDDLKNFTPIAKPDVLEGWDVQVGPRLYRVGVVRSGPADGMKKAFPDFAGGVATSCSIVLDEGHETSTFMTNMQTLAGKEPITKNVASGDFLVTTWAGGSAEIKVFLVAKANIGGRAGLLSVTILQKKADG
ncbi:MAG: hypothetical protein AAFZ01_13455 [Pseudomonadota bacterium]